MKIPDQINKVKIVVRNRVKRITRFHLNEKNSFIRYGLEASFISQIEYQRKKNKNHPINKQNLWDNGRKNLVLLEAEKEAEHYLNTHSEKEAEQFVLKQIEQGYVNIKDLPKKAQLYHRKILQRNINQPVVANKKQEKKQEKNINTSHKQDKTRKEIIEEKMESIDNFNSSLSEYFKEAYVSMPTKRQNTEQQWHEALSKHHEPFYKIYYQELLNKAQLLKAKERQSKEKKQSRENDLEL